MAITTLFDSASSIMTLISFLTFVGILLWTFVFKARDDFDSQAGMPFADEPAEADHG